MLTTGRRIWSYLIAAVVVVGICLSSIEASPGASSATSGRRPPPNSLGVIRFLGTARSKPIDLEGGAAPFVVTVRGAFYGNNVLGRVPGRSGKDALNASCTADERFWARRRG